MIPYIFLIHSNCFSAEPVTPGFGGEDILQMAVNMAMEMEPPAPPQPQSLDLEAVLTPQPVVPIQPPPLSSSFLSDNLIFGLTVFVIKLWQRKEMILLNGEPGNEAGAGALPTTTGPQLNVLERRPGICLMRTRS